MIKNFLTTGPAPNSYTIPTTIGFARHTLTKCRLPSITIGRKRANSPGHGHGLLYNLRDQTRFGRLYRPDFGLGTRRPLSQGKINNYFNNINYNNNINLLQKGCNILCI